MIPLHTSRNIPFVKICGQTHAPVVDCASSFGARMIGFIFHPGSPRSISPARAATIPSVNVSRVGVFVKQSGQDILPIMKQARLDYAQLHGRQTPEDARIIGAERVIRVLWPEHCATPAELQQQIDQWAPHCGCYLLDAGTPSASGGLGRQLNTAQLKDLRFPHPWILAGGLNEENLPDILRQCHPDGIDLNSGIETAPGLKSPHSILAAMRTLDRLLPA